MPSPPPPQPTPLPFWNTNLPPNQHIPTCPPYLAYAHTDPKDRLILSTPDQNHTPQTWAEIRTLLRENRLDAFQRRPSDLRRYREYCHALTQRHGSVMEFVVQHRLNWSDLTPKGTEPFECEGDHRVLLNDWPYGLDPRIAHLVVWTKHALPADPGSAIGDMLPATRAAIQEFVDERFVEECGREKVLWFKNWASLKSVHAVEHFHVLLFDPPSGFVERVTGGDVAVGVAGVDV
ncbi:hypothetical protein EJ03DRAFT_305828 [Teratosphaeria nubilosa]|uniref:N-acetylglucosamine-induced protein 1 n=1 Tax=Teratosphaeria nubilosa TaxID=161662 RepID=A0A6G1LLN6_9PEZI|nr:hypothetical protein EJ03DRAFT_305828 [Teratosphaeria nubilosa]